MGDRQNTKVLSITLVTVAGPLIAKADELPVHNRKGVRKSERKRRGGTLKLEQSSFSTLGHTLRVSRFSDIL